MDSIESLKTSVNEAVDKLVAKASQDYQLLKDKYEKLQITSTKEREESQTLRNNLISSTEKSDSLRSELTATNQKNEELQKQVTEFQKQLSSLKKRHEDLQKELTDSGSTLNIVLNKNADLEVSLNEAKTELKEIKNKLSLVSESNSKLETKLKQEVIKNSKLNKRLEEYKKIPERITNALGFINKSIQSSEVSEDEDGHQSGSDAASTAGGRGSNLSSPTSIENVSRTRSGARVSPRKDERDLSNTISMSPKVISLENLFKEKPASVEDKGKITQSSPASNINIPAVQPNQPVSVQSPKDNRNLRRSPIPSVSFATPISSSVDIEREKRSSPVAANLKSNQTNTVVSPKRDSPDPLRSSTPTILVPSNNISSVGSVSTEGLVDNRSPSPSLGGLQNRPIQPKSILMARSDNHTDRQSPLRSILVVTGASSSKDKEENNRKLAMEPAILANSKKDSASSISVTSDDQSKAKPASTDATKETRRVSPLRIRIPSNQTISSASPTGDTRNLRRSSISPVAATAKNQPTAKPGSTNEPKEDGNRPAAIAGAQNSQIMSVITPSKHQRNLSPRPGSPSIVFSPKTPSKILANSASGNKERDVHLNRSSLLVSRAQETQREADDASRGDNQTVSQPSSTAEPKPPPVVSEIASQQTLPPSSAELPPAPIADTDSTNKISRPEDLLPELFPGLRNTPRRSLTDSESSNNSRNVHILYEESENESQSPGTQSIPDTSSSNPELASLRTRFPIVCLSRVEFPEKHEQSPQDSKKSRKSSQEDSASTSKRRISTPENTPKRRKSHIEDIAAIKSPRVPRQIKQKFASCLICKKQKLRVLEFPTYGELDDHILKTHSKLNTVYVRCPYNGGKCKRHYSLSKQFRRHVLLRHPGENPDIEFSNHW